MSSVVKFYLNKSGRKPQFSHHINNIEKLHGQWSVLLFSNKILTINIGLVHRKVSTLDGKHELFDIVILTMPVPQVLHLKGEVQSVLGT